MTVFMNNGCLAYGQPVSLMPFLNRLYCIAPRFPFSSPAFVPVNPNMFYPSNQVSFIPPAPLVQNQFSSMPLRSGQPMTGGQSISLRYI